MRAATPRSPALRGRRGLALRVGPERGGAGGAGPRRLALPRERLLERGEHREHVLLARGLAHEPDAPDLAGEGPEPAADLDGVVGEQGLAHRPLVHAGGHLHAVERRQPPPRDRKSTRLNSSHSSISYAV